MVSPTPPPSPKSITISSPEFPIEPCEESSTQMSQETAAQEEEREREYLIQMIMQDKGVSREVAEAEHDSFN